MADKLISQLTQQVPADNDPFVFQKIADDIFYKALANAANGIPILDASAKIVQRLSYEGVASGVPTLDANTVLTDKLAINRVLASETALAAVDTTSGVTDGEIAWTSDQGLLWMYQSASIAMPSTHRVVAPTTGNGRWIARQFPTYGSNSNGSYVQFADGTQICWIDSIAVPYVTGYTLRTIWTYPASFIDSNVFGVPTVDSSSNASMTASARPKGIPYFDALAASAEIGFVSDNKYISTESATACVVAIGRWY